MSPNDQLTVWTVGHSTRSQDQFTEILKAHQIELLIDVRSFPGSRRYPHFNKDALADFLSAHEINYEHMPILGGRRRALPDSKNTAWNNVSFRGYADYMGTADFKRGIDELMQRARLQRTAIMCAEAVWWRCHRALVSDYLKSLGVEVVHIIDKSHTEEHPYTSAARLIDGRLSYEGLLP